MKSFIVLILILVSAFLNLDAQNVGIGTITPSEKLDVNGNIRTDTLKPNALQLLPNAGAGKILTSDVTGNASWENLVLPPPANNYNGNIGYGVWGDCATNGNISDYDPLADEEGAGFGISFGDHLGNSVSISGNYAVVGSYGDDGIAGINQGSVSFYHFEGNTWVVMQKIMDEDGAAWDFFGESVSISGNYAIVGSPQDDGDAGTDQGSVSFYQFIGSSWVLIQKITDADGDMNDDFGESVSISGNYAVIGSFQDHGPAGTNQGSVSIYQFDGSTWILMEKIFDSNGAPGDFFGNNVSISGANFVAGSYADDDVSGINQGSSSIYQFDGNNWIFVQKLTDVTGAANDNFGNSVSISGNYVIIGAPYDDGFAGTDQGSVSIYQFNGGTWALIQKQFDESGAPLDYFGQSVTVSGNYAIVGSGYDNIGSHSDQGSAHIYLRLGNTWERLQYVIDPRGNGADFFGFATAIDGMTKRFLIGSQGYANGMGKIVFGKIN